MKVRYSTLLLASLVGLALVQPALGVGTTGTQPLPASSLPGTPTFQPAQGQSSMCQSYALHDWRYELRYAYDPHRKTWEIQKYVAYRLHLPNGTPIPQDYDIGGPKPPENAGNPCLKPSSFAQTPPPVSAWPARYCNGCQHRPPPPTWAQVADKFPPPAPGSIAHGQRPVSVATGRRGKYWTVQVQYSWLATPDSSNGKWYFTGFSVTPSRKGS